VKAIYVSVKKAKKALAVCGTAGLLARRSNIPVAMIYYLHSEDETDARVRGQVEVLKRRRIAEGRDFEHLGQNQHGSYLELSEALVKK
jgi:hypothetical protein